MGNLDFLIDYLIRENKNITIKEVPQNICDKKILYRSLCNIRAPLPVPKKYIEIENEFLKKENKEAGIIKAEDIVSIIEYRQTQICLWQGNITTLKVEAIVNAANSQGIGCFVPCHKCIDNAIHSASGIDLSYYMNKI